MEHEKKLFRRGLRDADHFIDFFFSLAALTVVYTLEGFVSLGIKISTFIFPLLIYVGIALILVAASYVAIEGDKVIMDILRLVADAIDLGEEAINAIIGVVNTISNIGGSITSAVGGLF